MYDLISLSQTHGAYLTMAVVAVMFTLFLREAFPTEVVAMIGVSILLVTGVLSYEQAVGVFANPAPWTIAAMFVIVGALVRTDRWMRSRGWSNGRPSAMLRWRLGARWWWWRWPRRS